MDQWDFTVGGATQHNAVIKETKQWSIYMWNRHSTLNKYVYTPFYRFPQSGAVLPTVSICLSKVRKNKDKRERRCSKTEKWTVTFPIRFHVWHSAVFPSCRHAARAHETFRSNSWIFRLISHNYHVYFHMCGVQDAYWWGWSGCTWLT